MDKRKPKLEKVGCYFRQGNGDMGFTFFKVVEVKDGDLFIYEKGILWKLKKPKKQVGEKK